MILVGLSWLRSVQLRELVGSACGAACQGFRLLLKPRMLQPPAASPEGNLAITGGLVVLQCGLDLQGMGCGSHWIFVEFNLRTLGPRIDRPHHRAGNRIIKLRRSVTEPNNINRQPAHSPSG